MAVTIGLDIGGTKFMAAAADSSGKILRRSRRATPGTLQADLNTLHSMVEEMRAGEDVAAIGAAIGGPMDYVTGIVSPLHQPEWRGVPLRQIMEERWGCPFVVDVDTNIAALGEYHLGGVQAKRFLYITISTGMGGSFLMDGKIYRGELGAHPELAHITIPYQVRNPAGVQCECGLPDCLEGVISGNAIRRIYGKPAEQLQADEWDEVAYNLGQGLRCLAAVLAPGEIRLGGGVAVGGGEALVARAAEVMRANLRIIPAPVVGLSALGYDTALLGAVAAALRGTD